MKDGEVLKFQNEEELARAFANEVAENYVSHLEFWKATAKDYPEEYISWIERIRVQPDVVRENAFCKILSILKDANCEQYAKTWRCFKSKRFISITRNGGFYDDLLKKGIKSVEEQKDSESIKNAMPINVEYILNRKKNTLQKIIYSSYTDL